MSSRRVTRIFSAVAFCLLASVVEVRADHSLGNACTVCHSLRSAGVVLNTRNIKASLIDKNFPYGPDNAGTAILDNAWYCPGSTTSPRAKFDGVFSGGDPLDCSYCHKQATDDVGTEVGNASDLVGSGSPTASSHPVDTLSSTKSWGTVRIACNQCHNEDVSPSNLCTKATGTGYPNHKGTLTGDPTSLGHNVRKGGIDAATNTAHLRLGSYDATSGSAWTTTTGILCFDCHYSGGIASSAVKADYDRPNGGHNITSLDSSPATTGTLSKKLPCYNCHDPHGAATNKKLIIEPKAKVAPENANPYGTSYSATQLPPTGFAGTNDRVVCYGCHSGFTVEGEVLPDVLAAGWTPSAFPFHKNVHAGLMVGDPLPNCLQKNNGCHQGPHNTDIYRCLDCHSNAVPATNTNARLLAARHIGTEFGALLPDATGSIKLSLEVPAANAQAGTYGLKSRHDIPYDDTKAMNDPLNNGCLACHNVPATGKTPYDDTTNGGPGGPVAFVYDAQEANAYGNDPGWSARSKLRHFDPFCLSCHDGNDVSHGGTSKFTPAGTDYLAPEVKRYFATSGHGRITNFLVSNNPAANVPCLECHVYHGSTAFKLLPGDAATTGDSPAGAVIKGGGSTTGTKFAIGGVTTSDKIDYYDYTNTGTVGDGDKNIRLTDTFKYWSYYVSNYTSTTAWSTYYPDGDPETPHGTYTPFGTAGDMQADGTRSVGKNLDATGSAKIGFCNVCHFYNNSPDGTTKDNGTFGWVYTHEGIVGTDYTDGGIASVQSQKKFTKDCCECHDPHGSGKAGGSGNTDDNLYMVRGKIKHGETTSDTDVQTSGKWSRVILKSLTGTSSFDDLGSGNQTTSVCAVCHVDYTHATPPATSPDRDVSDKLNVDHNYRAWSGTADESNPHQEGKNCIACHSHGGKKGEGKGNQRLVAFGLFATCTGCHGLPPMAPTDPLTDIELLENYTGGGGKHKKHVDFLRTKLAVAPGDYSPELCAPCHGARPGAAAWHLDSDNPTVWNWPTGVPGKWQSAVDIVDGAANFKAAGATNTPKYNGVEVKTTSSAKGGSSQECTNLACHGPGTPPAKVTTSAQKLTWTQNDRSVVCAGCHGSTAPNATTPGGPGDPQTKIVVGTSYTSRLGAQGATASYYGTPSGYGRGGHGDSKIFNNDPKGDEAGCAWAFPATCLPPLACAACHVDPPTAQHFTGATGKPHFLKAPFDTARVLESTTDADGLCTSCHTQVNDLAPNGLPAAHHPSNVSFTRAYKPTGVTYDVAAPGDVDAFVMYWSSPLYTGIGAPAQVNLPRYGDVFNLTGDANKKLSCVTCHNPHGADLALDVSSGLGGSYSAFPNHMLRLRDDDKSLCKACHKD